MEQYRNRIYSKSLTKKIIYFLFITIPMHLIMLATAILPNTMPSTLLRGFLVRPFFKKCGRGFKLASGVIINQPKNIFIGKNVYIAHNSWLNGSGGITLEDNVIIGPMCVLVTTKHMFEDNSVSNLTSIAPIKIGKGTWLSAHVIVTDGVDIGEGTLVAAGAVVTKNFKKNSRIGGVPAKLLKKDL